MLIWRSLIYFIVAFHFSFIAYVAFGGFVIWKYPKFFFIHVWGPIYGILLLTLNFECPATWAENWARVHAGLPELPPQGFIYYYLGRHLFAQFETVLNTFMGTSVAITWIAALVIYRLRKSK